MVVSGWWTGGNEVCAPLRSVLPGASFPTLCHLMFLVFQKNTIKSIKGDSRDLRVFCFVFPLQAEKHHPALVKVLCAELGVEPEALLDFELCLTDTQPAVSVQINRWCSASTDNPVLLPEGLESHHTKQQLQMMLIMLVQSFLIMSYQVDVIVPRFCFPPSGTGRCVWRVHFLSSSWQPPQLLLRPAGWDDTLEFDNDTIFLLHIAFQKSSSLSW